MLFDALYNEDTNSDCELENELPVDKVEVIMIWITEQTIFQVDNRLGITKVNV